MIKAWLIINCNSIFPSILLVQCRTDRDCPLDKTCKANECVDPCQYVICGSQAQCKAEQHKGICICQKGLQGNPYISCLRVGCQSNDDCASNEKCDYQSRNCIQLCINHKCAQGARCEAIDHKEICTCNYPLEGDGFSFCSERKQTDFKFFGVDFK